MYKKGGKRYESEPGTQLTRVQYVCERSYNSNREQDQWLTGFAI